MAETAETEGMFRFSTFHAGSSEKPDDHPGDGAPQVEDKYVHQALVYLYRNAGGNQVQLSFQGGQAGHLQEWHPLLQILFKLED